VSNKKKKFLQFCNWKRTKYMQEPKHWNALGTNIVALRAKVKSSRSENRRLRQRNKELVDSRDLWHAKYKALKASPLRSVRQRPEHASKAQRYKYSVQTIQMSVYLYLVLGCGYRGIVKVLLYIQLEFGLIGLIPSKSIMAVWVQKLGYYSYTHPVLQTADPYGIIIDECMVIGQQRLLLILGVKAQKDKESALTYQQVSVLSISVQSSWKAEQIRREIEKVTEKMGRKPAYIISDGNSNLRKGIADSECIRIADVSHQMALIVEKYYRHNVEFISWQKTIAQAKFKGIMQDVAYLLPPKQRVIARFMNLEDSIRWSRKIIGCFEKLSTKEQGFFMPIREHQGFIEQIEIVFAASQQIVDLLKVRGLSYQNIEQCMDILKNYQKRVNRTIIRVMEDYLQAEKLKLPNEDTVWHCCSNCLESLFAKFKQKLPDNSLYGITKQVLALPLRTNKELKFDIKNALENVSMADLDQWGKAVLSDNQVVRRRNVLQT
jgi:hypothetical protein